MRFWHSVLVSLLFHAAILSIPIAVSVTGNIPEEIPFCIVPGPEVSGMQASSGAGGSAPENNGQPPNQSSQETSPPEEPRESRLQEPDEVPEPVPAPQKERAPVVLAKEKPKPPKPKPENKPAKPPPPRPQSPDTRPETPLRDPAPPAQRASEELSSKQGKSENPSEGAGPAGHPSTSGQGGPAGHGAVQATFGSGDGPRFVSRTLPRYPRLAREIGKEGTVLLCLTIDERGRLVDVELLEPAGSGFDEEAVQAIKKSTFSPATRNGKPVTCRAHLPIRFVLRSTKND